jgi:hypothetical protein
MDYDNLFIKFVDKYPNVNIDKLRIFILNIALLLNEVRLGYIENISFDHPYTFKEIISDLSDYGLSFKEFKSAFLITLNKNNVNSDNIGFILGYPPVGSGWNNSSIDRYRIGITANGYELFGFFCSVENFTREVKDHIKNIIDKGDIALEKLSFQMKATYQLWPGNQNYKYFLINL